MNTLLLKENKRIVFEVLKSVNNPTSVHGIYPYRGKISAVDAAQVIKQLPHRGTLLDPFCGSGTIIYEAKKQGHNVIGVDNNPIAIQIAKGKFYDGDIAESLSKISKIISNIKSPIRTIPAKAKKYFHPKTAKQIMSLLPYYEKFNDYEKAIFLGTICLTARGCNKYAWSSTQIGKIADEHTYIDFFDKFVGKIKKHYHPVEQKGVKIIYGDTRQLSKYIQKNSVDFVYTSPPYFDALDYTSNYTRIIHYIFENTIEDIKKGLIQNYDSYKKDMQECFKEIDKITKKDALIIFVVGDKKRGEEIINGGNFFSNIFEQKPSFVVERKYSGTASKIWDKINKTDRKEQIVVWDKASW